ncbi:hypothetical protein GQ53DRAFT_833110 [Thozetella sp. PMI_491]|nr:hypothetical protein GQ53DRAFT_833110 [Thozetella sp. PMI_491]
MSSSSDPYASYADGPVLNSLFIGLLVACGVVSVFFLLYFNRLFATAISWGIRTWTWHQYRVYIDIQALQISLLGGRIFFTGLRYHGNNETILVQNGHITWSYWLRRVKEVDVGKNSERSKTPDPQAEARKARLPCRINVALLGLEWFIYNRTPAYDSVLAGMTDDLDNQDTTTTPGQGEQENSTKLKQRLSKRFEAEDGITEKRYSDQTSRPEEPTEPRRHDTVQTSGSDTNNEDDDDKSDADGVPLLIQLFPIHIECEKAALVMGNENTKAILIVKADSLDGEIDASDTSTPDPYRQIFRLNFVHPVVEMKENLDFKEEQAERALREKQIAEQAEPGPRKSYFRRQRRKVLGQLRNLVPYWRKSVESLSIDSHRGIGTAGTHVPGVNHWQGLSRYLGDDRDDQKARWAAVEYAAVPTILDSPQVLLTIYWDVVGRARPRRPGSKEKSSEALRNINGDEPPAWAINLSIKGGSVNYGPWADRQRADLQRVFVPSLCKDATPAKRLAVGEYRIPTQFKLYVELDEEVTLRVPTREDSKNWRWNGKEPGPKQTETRGRKSRNRSKKPDQASAAHQRPYGWLDIKVAANASISYSMDMTAGASGFSNSLDLDLPSTEISSSINHELLWRSGRQRISCDLSNPLRWNSLRQWRFNVDSDELELFLLRDHVFLLIDLVDDWASGPPADYLVFTPFKYHLNLQLHNLKLYLNVNDRNIIDNPTDLEDNTYIIIESPLLQSKVCIPIDSFRPSKNAIPFDVRADTASVRLHVPDWNTQDSFLTTNEIGQLENLTVDGGYHYNATTSPAKTDTLVLNVGAQSPVARLHGFLIRYFLKIKDNYFGEDVHFKTLEEYQQATHLKESNPDAEAANGPPPKKSNDLDVILSLRIDDPKAMLASNLYSSNRNIQLDTAAISVDLRFTNYYMDLDLVLAPLNLSLGTADSGSETPISTSSSTQLFIDGIHIYGSRLFGLPPTEPTYLCNWDINVGAVTGECSVQFLTSLANAGKAFGFSFDDDENALVTFSSIVFYDVTFLRAFVQSVCIWLHVEEAAFQLSTGSIEANYNDWARSHYSKRADVKIPDIQIACVDAESATRNFKSRAHSRPPVETNALIQTTIHLASIGRKFDFSGERRLQQELVRREDQRTNRTPFLLLHGLLDELVPDAVDPPAQSVPPIPQPIAEDDVEQVEEDGTSLASSRGTSKYTPALRRQSSFLSFSSSSQSSIVKPRSSGRSSIRKRNGKPDSLQHLTVLDRRPSAHAAEPSPTRRRVSFNGGGGDPADRHQDVFHNTVAFSSQYFAPYFPLENARPDTREATLQSVELGDDDSEDNGSVNFDLEDIDPDILSQESAYSSTIVEMPSGLTVFADPTALRHVANLLSTLQPSDPEDVLDSLQLDSMGDIFDMQKDQKTGGRVSDLLVRFPRASLKFVNSSALDSSDPPQEEQDQYGVSISKFAFAMRSEHKWQDAFKPDTRDTRNSFHLRLSSIELAAAERLGDTQNPQAAVLAQVDNVMASMGSKDITYLDIDIGNIQGSTSSEKIEYLASLIHRTGVLASELGDVFGDTSSREEDLKKYLAYRLITGGRTAPDPKFLVRPSAVLRSAKDHLRTFDSWKLVTRLRQLWTVMDRGAQEQLRLDCLAQLDYPADVRQQVVTAFQRWRSWDLGNLSGNALLTRIFGPANRATSVEGDEKPFLSVVRTSKLQLILDPGPKQNEVSFFDLTARLETATPVEENPNEPAEKTIESPVPISVLNLYCGEAAVNLNWELCELAHDILRLFKRMQSKARPQSSPKPDRPSSLVSTKQNPRTIHCVLVINNGSVTMDAINLHASSVGSDMKASLLIKTGAEDLTETHFVLSCDTVTSRLRSHAQHLTKFVLHRPSVIVAHELQTTETTDCHTVKATASSNNLTLTVKQDPIVLSEVLDLLVRDEIAQLVRLKDQLPTSPKPASPSKKIVDRLSAFRVNVAMFMDQFTISIPLLRSLTYNIHGTVARAAMAADFGKEIVFDFDIKENSHEMRIEANDVSRSVSILQIPPTNGRVTSHMSAGEHNVTVFASLELVQLDASAVYSLLTALNRPEVSNAINDLQQQIKVIQEHTADLFGSSDSPAANPVKEESDTLVYAAHLTFAGLEVFGTSPLQSETASVARISFCLDSIHLEAANRVEQQGPVLAYPEFHANLRLIDFEIQKGPEEALSSCGNVTFGALVTATSTPSDMGEEKRFFNVRSDRFEVNLSPDTVSTVVDVLGYMGDKIKDLDTSRELEYLRKLRQSKPRIAINDEEEADESDIMDAFFSSITWTFEVCDIRVAWLVTKPHEEPTPGKEDLVLTLERIEFGTKTRNSARLTIENLQVEIVNSRIEKRGRAPNSALLPEVIFNVAYVTTADARRLAFQAVGKSLDIRLTSGFIIPAANLNDSIGLSIKNAQQASQNWNPVLPPAPAASTPVEAPKKEEPRRNIFGSKRLESFLVHADFAGAVVYVTGKRSEDIVSASRAARASLPGKYGQFTQDDSATSTVLRSPGLAWKMEYSDGGVEDPSLFAEIKIDASSNILYPSVVPLIVGISNSVKQVVSSRDRGHEAPVQQKEPEKPKEQGEENILTADPTAVLGRMKLNLGLRISKQEFSLSCQPIARVAATASFEDVYFTVNTVRSVEQGNFFAISGAFTNLQASVQHVYSRESTGSFEVESIVVSLMNSKHVSGTSGVSAILKVSPMKVSVNAKQLQDFLLFREIWMPPEVHESTPTPVAKLTTETSQGHLVQRYQQVAATAAFPWTATISITALEINVDLGQALGKSVFAINKFWISSKKTSDWEQNLCLGFDRIGIDSTGRMSGFVALQDFKLRTSIQWPEREAALNETPLVQASVGFSQFRVKASFDYQPFLVADITSMAFLMYNVRRSRDGSGDRLVAIFDGDAVQIFGTTTSAAQGVAMYQAFLRLVQERRANFETSLREIEKFMKRKSVSAPAITQRLSIEKPAANDDLVKSPISLDTDVVVTLKTLNLGVFPSTFSDHQVFKMEALNAQARFAATMEDDRRIHSILGLTLGQLRIGLAGVRSPPAPKTLRELDVEDVVGSATGSRGGTILKVPRVEAVMQTWQRPQSRHIDYIFKSAFEGKVEVGWNYSRISYIRGMWANHSKTLAQTWGRELPNVTAIRVTGVPEAAAEGEETAKKPMEEGSSGKITAEVTVPQSKYEYTALEPPVIETPQLRDMGEATPPLEWIGLNRDRLPNLTHQIVIVSLLELAGEVEDAYSRILGSS